MPLQMTITDFLGELEKVQSHVPTQSAIWRWCVKGYGKSGIFLNHYRCGSRILLTLDDWHVFQEAVKKDMMDFTRRIAPPRPRQPNQKHVEARAAWAKKILDEAGV